MICFELKLCPLLIAAPQFGVGFVRPDQIAVDTAHLRLTRHRPTLHSQNTLTSNEDRSIPAVTEADVPILSSGKSAEIESAAVSKIPAAGANDRLFISQNLNNVPFYLELLFGVSTSTAVDEYPTDQSEPCHRHSAGTRETIKTQHPGLQLCKRTW